MNFLPIFYNITDKPCLVVGGGSIAARKAELLLRSGGRVRLVAPDIGARVQEMMDWRTRARDDG
jgi:uroporphyrin-III C-methyltransferase/precorrin-2 dehydrogenase/sirohydrochlorin ferrochelatase